LNRGLILKLAFRDLSCIERCPTLNTMHFNIVDYYDTDLHVFIYWIVMSLVNVLPISTIGRLCSTNTNLVLKSFITTEYTATWFKNHYKQRNIIWKFDFSRRHAASLHLNFNMFIKRVYVHAFPVVHFKNFTSEE
jgi:hypothetical protein